MKLTACHLFFLFIVTFELGVGSYVSTVTSSPSYTEEVPSTHTPQFLTNSTLVSVVEGQSVTFQCSVDELGEFVIVWKKNTEVYFADTYNVKKDPRFVLKDDKSIHIKNVHIKDAGNYICQISTTPPIELNHVLIVGDAPVVKTIPKSGVLTVTLGEPIEIRCDISSNPNSRITWTHSMKEVSKYVQDGNISIPSAEKKHAGIYECKVDNGVDVPSLGKIHVKVHYKPIIEIPRRLIYTGEGASVEISCITDGEPTPTIKWLKDGKIITLSRERHQITASQTHTLRIRKVTSNDLGIYTCKASNRLGHAIETIEVTGVPAPVEFKTGLNDVKSDSYSIKWSVRSHSPITEIKLKFRKRKRTGEVDEWTIVDIPVEKNPGLIKTHTYNITGLEPASVYEAIIVTRNDFGWNNRSDVFIFSTEGAVIGGEEDIEETVIETNEPQESMSKTNDVTSSSIAETRTNIDAGDSAGSLHCTIYLITAMLWISTYLW